MGGKIYQFVYTYYLENIRESYFIFYKRENTEKDMVIPWFLLRLAYAANLVYVAGERGKRGKKEERKLLCT